MTIADQIAARISSRRPTITWTRVAPGDYESTVAGRSFYMYRIPDVNPPAWNVEDVSDPYNTSLIVDGAASMRDAIGIFEDVIA